jgi:hypothetical protein
MPITIDLSDQPRLSSMGLNAVFFQLRFFSAKSAIRRRIDCAECYEIRSVNKSHYGASCDAFIHVNVDHPPGWLIKSVSQQA